MDGALYPRRGPGGRGFDFSGSEQDYALDLNGQLIRNKASTCSIRMVGEAMIDAGIQQGDLLIVDRSVKAINGKIVVAILNGEMMIRRFEKNFNRIRLVPETKKLSPIDIDLNGCEFAVWGVVTYVIHAL